MKLAYRGLEYDYNPPMLEVTNSEIALKYRGHALQHTYVRHVPIPQISERLTYRGVTYQTTRQGGIQQLDSTTAHANGASVPQGGVSLASLRDKLSGMSDAAKARRQLLQVASEQHNASIARSLQHRINVAKSQGNAPLIEQLETEMRQNVQESV